ncbi:unnamed protein product, partial [Pylaiella littoralis]
MWAAKEKMEDNSLDFVDVPSPPPAPPPPPPLPIRIMTRKSSVLKAMDFFRGSGSSIDVDRVRRGGGDSSAGGDEKGTSGNDRIYLEGGSARPRTMEAAAAAAAAGVSWDTSGAGRTGTTSYRKLEEGAQGGRPDLSSHGDDGSSSGAAATGPAAAAAAAAAGGGGQVRTASSGTTTSLEGGG